MTRGCAESCFGAATVLNRSCRVPRPGPYDPPPTSPHTLIAVGSVGRGQRVNCVQKLASKNFPESVRELPLWIAWQRRGASHNVELNGPRAARRLLFMGYENSRRCALWVRPRILVAAEELAELLGVDVDTFIESTVLALREQEATAGFEPATFGL